MQNCNIKKYPELNKKYELIIFDWDGTAVADRESDTKELKAVIESLLYQKIYIVIITGTNINNINKQFNNHLNNKSLDYLYICTNRGSESYGFNKQGEQILLYKKEANNDENKILDKIAEITKKELETKFKINTNIIYNRLNRRKIDLLPEWSDPKKSEFNKLLIDVENKLKNSHLKKGLIDAVKLVEKIATKLNATNLKITSDIKHLEVGLTDKSDTMNWIIKNVANPNKIKLSKILVLGDEFGEIGGFQGSDYKMVVSTQPKYFSVGIEPNGVPAPIIHIGGGPDCFLEILKQQLSLIH